ncbi:MAG: hypothetical protein ABSC94_14540 [Polyangiaceae bacterium]|jgi:hypothetical protein
MIDVMGVAPRVVPSGTLWLMLAPLLGGLTVLGIGATRSGRMPWARHVGVIVVGLSAGACLGHGAGLALAWPAEPNRTLVELLPGRIRLGSLSIGLTLSCDRLAAAASGLASLLALVVAIAVASRAKTAESVRVWAWIEIALGGVLLSVLADGLVTLGMGWALAIGAGAWIGSWTDPQRLSAFCSRGAAAMVALLLGSTVLFWGLGGSWSGEDYVRDTRAPIAAIPVGPPSAEGSSVTMVTLPGALVFVDDTRTPTAVAPFAKLLLAPGPHGLRIEDAAEKVVVDFTVPSQGADYAVISCGPTLSFRELSAALTQPREAGDSSLGSVLRGRSGPGGLDVVSVTVAAWGIAAFGLRAALPDPKAPVALRVFSFGALGALPGSALLMHAGVLLSLTPNMVWPLAAAWASIVFTSIAGLYNLIADRGSGRMTTASPPGHGWFERAASQLGTLLLNFEVWVLDSISAAGFALVGVAGWVAARVDVDVVGAPVDAAAVRVRELGRRVRPAVGSFSWMAWTALAIFGAIAVVRAIWPGR